MQSAFVVGLNHRSAPVEVRERLSLGRDEVPRRLEELRTVGLAEALLLSTCNRIEIYGWGEWDDAARTALTALCAQRGLPVDAVRPFAYAREGREAVHHCFRVAASLDSMIVGEPQILGQVKDAFELASRAGGVGPRLHELFEQAFAVAKRVRTETELARHAVSVPFAAVELAKKIFGDLRQTSALLIGAGEMGEQVARHLVQGGIASLAVANRTWSRAVALAESLRGTPVSYEEWAAALDRVDIVIASAAAPRPIIGVEAIRQALAARRARPLFLIDIAVPRNVEPGVDTLAGAYCYDVDDLEGVVEANRQEREREARRAEALVEREVEKFLLRTLERSVSPTIVSLREKVEAIRRAEVARALRRLQATSPEAYMALEALSSALVNKILHEPTIRLRQASRSGGGDRWSALVRELFALDRGTTPTVPAA